MDVIFLFSLLVPFLVGLAVIPRRRDRQRVEGEAGGDSVEQRFPWFWVTFPMACMAAGGVCAVGLRKLFYPNFYQDWSFGWTMYMPLADADEVPMSASLGDSTATLVCCAVLFVILTGASVALWRAGRY